MWEKADSHETDSERIGSKKGKKVKQETRKYERQKRIVLEELKEKVQKEGVIESVNSKEILSKTRSEKPPLELTGKGHR